MSQGQTALTRAKKFISACLVPSLVAGIAQQGTLRNGSLLFLFVFPFSSVSFPFLGIVQKVFPEKASAIARMRQKCVKNSSKMRQNGSRLQKCTKMGPVLLEKRNVPKMRQKCVKNVSKMRGTSLGENTFWTIPRFRDAEMMIKIIFERSSQKGGRQGVPKEGQQGTHLEI